MNIDRNTIIGVVLAALFFQAWLFRYEVTPIMAGDGLGGAYVLDRWSGEVRFLRGFGINQPVPPTSR